MAQRHFRALLDSTLHNFISRAFHRLLKKHGTSRAGIHLHSLVLN
jgi:hypothetical protein